MNDEDLRRLLAEVDDLRERIELPRRERARFIQRREVGWVGSTAISAATGTTQTGGTPGSGTVTLLTIDANDTFQTVKDSAGSDVTVTVKNWVNEASGTDRRVWIEQNGTGIWFLVNEAC